MTKDTIVFISRSSKFHREGRQLFHEEKVANFLVEKFKTIILSTSLKDNQKNTIKYTNNNIEYIYLPNCKPEKFTYNFQKELKKYINILSAKNKKLVIFGNDFSLYPLSLSKNFEKIKFIHNIHSPPITSFEISENLFITIYNFIKNFRRLLKRIIKNNFSYRNIIKKKNHKIVFSSLNLKKFFLFYISKL